MNQPISYHLKDWNCPDSSTAEIDLNTKESPGVPVSWEDLPSLGIKWKSSVTTCVKKFVKYIKEMGWLIPW